MPTLISTGQEAEALQALDDLWDTMGEEVTIVKEPTISVIDINASYIPGFNLTSNVNNFIPEPESRTFPCLVDEKKADRNSQAIHTKQDALQFVYLKVQQDARDYIQDGRRNLHAVLNNRKYNIVSDEEVRHMLSRAYYVFKLEITR